MTTRTAMPGFTAEARQLIERLEDAGVTFRVSSKNHAIGVAPNGAGTISIPRKFTGRGRRNAEASTERLLANIAKAHGAVQAVGKATDVLLTTEGSPITDRIIANGALAKLDAIKETAMPTAPTLVSKQPWLAHKAASASGGKKYQSHTTVERLWSDGSIDYECALPGCGYDSHRPVSVARHYGRSNDHPKPEGDYQANEVPANDYLEPLTHRHTPSQSRIEAILALLAQHPDASEDATLEELVRLILAADMERDPLYERGTPDEGPFTDGQIVARIRALVGATDKEAELTAQVTDLTTRLADSEAEVERLRGNINALRDLLEGAS